MDGSKVAFLTNAESRPAAQLSRPRRASADTRSSPDEDPASLFVALLQPCLLETALAVWMRFVTAYLLAWTGLEWPHDDSSEPECTRGNLCVSGLAPGLVHGSE